jgi:hypothetical protein
MDKAAHIIGHWRTWLPWKFKCWHSLQRLLPRKLAKVRFHGEKSALSHLGFWHLFCSARIVDPRTHNVTESGLFPNFFLASKEKGCIQASPWCLQHFYPTWLLRMDLKAPTMIIIVPLTMLAQKNMKCIRVPELVEVVTLTYCKFLQKFWQMTSNFRRNVHYFSM